MVLGPTVHYQGLPGDESRIGPGDRRQPPPQGPLAAYRVRGRAHAARAPSLLLACPSAQRAYLKLRRHELSRTTECTGRSVRNRLNGLKRGTAPIEASSENSQT